PRAFALVLRRPPGLLPGEKEMNQVAACRRIHQPADGFALVSQTGLEAAAGADAHSLERLPRRRHVVGDAALEQAPRAAKQQPAPEPIRFEKSLSPRAARQRPKRTFVNSRQELGQVGIRALNDLIRQAPRL